MPQETIKSVKKENEALKLQLEDLRREFKNFQQTTMAKMSDHGGQSAPSPDLDTIKSLDFLSNQYDDLQAFRELAMKQMQRFNDRLDFIEEQVTRIGTAIDEAQRYSYQYNLKIIGVPEQGQEKAQETVKLCVDLFNVIGVDVTEGDIDIAHRVPSRKKSNDPQPIICKFTRRSVKEQILTVRKEISKVNPNSIGLPENTSLSRAIIFEHLFPKAQYLLTEAKKIQSQLNYRFCWAKNQRIYMKRTEDSRRIIINSLDDLEKLN